MKSTLLEINCEALRNNLSTYRALLKSETKVMVMVKAFGYGNGLAEIGKLCQQEQVDYLGVAYLSEAIELRNSGITIPILVMNPEMTDFQVFEEYDLQADIYSLAILNRFIASGSSAKIHLKLETGMNRLGFLEKELDELISLLANNPELKVEGMLTHFSSSDDWNEDEYTLTQAKTFDRMSKLLIDALGYAPILHVLNSPGIVHYAAHQYDMIRLGIGLYGYDPTDSLKLDTVGTLKTQVSQIRKIKKGESISYSRSGRADSDMTIAILPIGYADGYLRVFGNGNAKVSIKGKLMPTIGNICMDLTIIDITGLDVKGGEEVIVFGDEPSIEQLAIWANTIPYEVLTTIGQRVKRVYLNE